MKSASAGHLAGKPALKGHLLGLSTRNRCGVRAVTRSVPTEQAAKRIKRLTVAANAL